MGGVERTVTVLITAWLVIVPWLIGGRFWWSQALSAVIGGGSAGYIATLEGKSPHSLAFSSVLAGTFI